MIRSMLTLQIGLLIAASFFLGLFWFGQSMEPVEHFSQIQVHGERAVEHIIEPRFRWEVLSYIGFTLVGIIELIIAVRIWRFNLAWRRECEGL